MTIAVALTRPVDGPEVVAVLAAQGIEAEVRAEGCELIVSADDVAAVRRGLRMALPCASRPVTPRHDSSHPIARDIGRANVATSITTPKKASSAPTATTSTRSTS